MTHQFLYRRRELITLIGGVVERHDQKESYQRNWLGFLPNRLSSV
jgi:hypothetical protein